MSKHTPTAGSIRVAIIQRVVPHYRAPLFQQLSDLPNLQVRVFAGRSVPHTKLANADGLAMPLVRRLRTVSCRLKISGRIAPVVLHPGLVRAVRKFRPDVLVCEGGSNLLNNLLLIPYACATKTPVIWWSLGALPGRKHSLVGRAGQLVARALERRATSWLGYSQAARQYYRSRGFPSSRVFVATNCLATNSIRQRSAENKESAEVLRNRLGLTGCFVYLFVGVLTEGKRVGALVRAFRQVQESHHHARLLVVGDGPEASKLSRLAHDLRVSEKVLFTGAVRENVDVYFQAAQVFVLPGLGGLAIAQAMANGLPVICGQADGTERDYVLPERTGMLVAPGPEPGYTKRLAHTMARLLADSDRTRDMGAAALAHICQNVNEASWARAVQEAIACTIEVAQGRAGSAPV